MLGNGSQRLHLISSTISYRRKVSKKEDVRLENRVNVTWVTLGFTRKLLWLLTYIFFLVGYGHIDGRYGISQTKLNKCYFCQTNLHNSMSIEVCSNLRHV